MIYTTISPNDTFHTTRRFCFFLSGGIDVCRRRQSTSSSLSSSLFGWCSRVWFLLAGVSTSWSIFPPCLIGRSVQWHRGRTTSSVALAGPFPSSSIFNFVRFQSSLSKSYLIQSSIPGTSSISPSLSLLQVLDLVFTLSVLIIFWDLLILLDLFVFLALLLPMWNNIL